MSYAPATGDGAHEPRRALLRSEIREISSGAAGPSAARAHGVPEPQYLIDDEATLIDAIPTAEEPTDVPVEIASELSASFEAGPCMLFRERFCITCRWHDGGAGAPILISY